MCAHSTPRFTRSIVRRTSIAIARTNVSSRELTLVRAMAIEVLRTIDRVKRGLE